MNRDALKLWAMIALVAAAVAAIHMAFTVSWAAKRDAGIWVRLSAVDGRLMSVERWKVGADRRLEEVYGEADDPGR